MVAPSPEYREEKLGAYAKIYHVPGEPSRRSPSYWVIMPKSCLMPHSPLRRIISGERPELVVCCDKIYTELSIWRPCCKAPTTLILVDEADCLRVASLEQCAIFAAAGEIGLILIGMPGLEKRLARYPKLCSRIGFVHEFRPLAAAGIRQLLEQRWTPAGVQPHEQPWDSETAAAVIRITGGNFRLLNQLLTRIERTLEINASAEFTKAVVEAARESLGIGKA